MAIPNRNSPTPPRVSTKGLIGYGYDYQLLQATRYGVSPQDINRHNLMTFCLELNLYSCGWNGKLELLEDLISKWFQ